MTEFTGPRLTTSSLNTIQGEDHLGIKNIAIIIADTLQSGITSITPRGRYWAFYAWVLHDFIQTQEDKSIDAFKKYLKKQEWYFILANIAYAKSMNQSTNQLVGVSVGDDIWSKDDLKEIPYFEHYLKNSFGGFNIYRNVMKIIGITRDGDINKGVQLDRLTPVGKELAILFQKNIEDTKYFQEWRLKETPVPREILLQYGEKVSLSLLHQGYEKDLLRSLFLEKDSEVESKKYRYSSMMYYQHIVKVNNGKKLNQSIWRKFMYDVFSPRGEMKQNLPLQFEEVARGWEFYQGRQLFTYSLESIWSYVLDRLAVKTLSVKDLVNDILAQLESDKCPIGLPLSTIVSELPLRVEERESYLKNMNSETYSIKERLWNAFLILLDVFVRFQGRNEFQFGSVDFKQLGGSEHISIRKWEEDVNQYLNKPIKEMIQLIIRSYILQQHKQVALNKVLSTGNDTYHFVENDGLLYHIKGDKPSYNVFRVDQAMTILADLGYIKKVNGTWMNT